MGYRSLRRSVRWALGALMLTPGLAPAAMVEPDGSDTRTGAHALRGSFIAAIDRPGDHDWYSMRGSDSGEPAFEIVDISVLRAGPGCTASRPLFVVLRNPEGRWIRTYSVSRERADVLVSGLPGRYYLEIRAADSSCSTLFYGLAIISQTVRLAQDINQAIHFAQTFLASDVSLCRITHNERVRVAGRIRAFQRRRRSLRSRAARRRYAGYVRAELPNLKRARAKERRECAKDLMSR